MSLWQWEEVKELSWEESIEMLQMTYNESIRIKQNSMAPKRIYLKDLHWMMEGWALNR